MPGSFTENESLIRSRFETQWTALRPAVTAIFDNVGDTAKPEDEAWIRLVVLPGNSGQVEFGMTRRWRRAGVVSVQIFVPAASGTGLAMELGDTVKTIFEGLTVSGLIFRATSLNRVGLDGPWLQYNANTPYQADELR
jgi:hypothetical protein